MRLDIMGDLRETAPMGRAGSWVILASLVACATHALGAPGDIGNTSPSLAEAFAAGTPLVELRPRYNHIEESDKPETARGMTLRAIAGWRTAPWHGVRLTVEAIHAGAVGTRRFNDDPAFLATSPYPLLPDPRHTGVNQAHLELQPLEEVRLRLGRQRVIVDDGRWVSDNDFRQVPQLFDGGRVTYTGIADTALTAAHFGRVRSTSGASQALRLSVLHAARSPRPGLALAAYGYFHDQARNGAFTGFADSSYRVHGVRARGALAAGDGLDIEYLAEAARQRAFAGGDARIDAAYWRAGLGLAGPRWNLRVDHETKGSNQGRYGVQMPLTDFYAFNGWSLRFFNTPSIGLRDLWATLRLVQASFTLYAEAHRFRSDFGGVDLGREVDVGLTYELRPDTIVRLQHADYRPGTEGPRIRKSWLTLTWSF
jgi:hypothetical protein